MRYFPIFFIKFVFGESKEYFDGLTKFKEILELEVQRNRIGSKSWRSDLDIQLHGGFNNIYIVFDLLCPDPFLLSYSAVTEF